MFNEDRKKVITFSSHTSNAEPTQVLSTELLICWKVAEEVWSFKSEEKRGNIDVSLLPKGVELG
jgi:hypothetical protein